MTPNNGCGDVLDWHDCYNSDVKYKKYVTAESFAHPAKFSFGLLERIFKHLRALGYLSEDTTIVDYMAGSGRTNLMASLEGYKTVAVELEPHFIAMQEGNKKLLERKIGRKTEWEIIQGDSRNLSQILNGGGVGVVSPPYSTELEGATRKDRGRKDWFSEHPEIKKRGGGIVKGELKFYDTPNNIANLPDKQVAGIISPPYGEATQTFSQKSGKFKGTGKIGMGEFVVGKCLVEMNKQGYSSNPSNIGNLPDSPLVGIMSPPYGDIAASFRNTGSKLGGDKFQYGSMGEENIGNLADTADYEDNTKAAWWRNKAAQNQSESYLEAMLKCYSESFRSGISPLVVVVKDPTKQGKIRELGKDTCELLLRAGYEIFDYHKAILFTEHVQTTLDGASKRMAKGRMSFFKRLAFERGSPVSDFEHVIFAKIP